MNFADAVCQMVEEKGPLVVGLDPHPNLLPPYLVHKWFKEKGETLEALAACVLEFNRLILNSISPYVGIVKVQMAFYEMLGVPGMITLKHTLEEAKKRGMLIILDGKRNDVASTAWAYAWGYLSGISWGENKNWSPAWDGDALTITPYFGEDGLWPFFQEAEKNDKGVFVLCRTTNPSAPFIQDEGKNEKLFVKVARLVEQMGKTMKGESGLSSAGIVVGATYPDDLEFLRKEFPALLFLVPGVGTQGGKIDHLKKGFRQDGLGTIVNLSRRVIFAYREAIDTDGWGFEKKAQEQALFYQNALNQLRI